MTGQSDVSSSTDWTTFVPSLVPDWIADPVVAISVGAVLVLVYIAKVIRAYGTVSEWIAKFRSWLGRLFDRIARPWRSLPDRENQSLSELAVLLRKKRRVESQTEILDRIQRRWDSLPDGANQEVLLSLLNIVREVISAAWAEESFLGIPKSREDLVRRHLRVYGKIISRIPQLTEEIESMALGDCRIWVPLGSGLSHELQLEALKEILPPLLHRFPRSTRVLGFCREVLINGSSHHVQRILGSRLIPSGMSRDDAFGLVQLAGRRALLDWKTLGVQWNQILHTTLGNLRVSKSHWCILRRQMAGYVRWCEPDILHDPSRYEAIVYNIALIDMSGLQRRSEFRKPNRHVVIAREIQAILTLNSVNSTSPRITGNIGNFSTKGVWFTTNASAEAFGLKLEAESTGALRILTETGEFEVGDVRASWCFFGEVPNRYGHKTGFRIKFPKELDSGARDHIKALAKRFPLVR